MLSYFDQSSVRTHTLTLEETPLPACLTSLTMEMALLMLDLSNIGGAKLTPSHSTS